MQPTSTVLVAKPVDPVPEGVRITRLQAQVKLGLFAAHDWLMLSLTVCSFISIGLFAIAGKLTLGLTAILLLLSCIFLLLWLIILAYRCLIFILDLHADISLLPEAAARIAVGFFEGRARK